MTNPTIAIIAIAVALLATIDRPPNNNNNNNNNHNNSGRNYFGSQLDFVLEQFSRFRFSIFLTLPAVEAKGRETKFCAQTVCNSIFTLGPVTYLQSMSGVWYYISGMREPAYDIQLRQFFFLKYYRENKRASALSAYEVEQDWFTGFLIPADEQFGPLGGNTGMLISRDYGIHVVWIEIWMLHSDSGDQSWKPLSDVSYGQYYWREMSPPPVVYRDERNRRERSPKSSEKDEFSEEDAISLRNFVGELERCTQTTLYYIAKWKKLLVACNNASSSRYEVKIYEKSFLAERREIQYSPTYGFIHGMFTQSKSSSEDDQDDNQDDRESHGLTIYFYTEKHLGIFNPERERFLAIAKEPEFHRNIPDQFRPLILMMERFGCEEHSVEARPDQSLQKERTTDMLYLLNAVFVIINTILLILLISICVTLGRRAAGKGGRARAGRRDRGDLGGDRAGGARRRNDDDVVDRYASSNVDSIEDNRKKRQRITPSPNRRRAPPISPPPRGGARGQRIR